MIDIFEEYRIDKEKCKEEKKLLFQYHRINKLNKTLAMFSYKKLPDTIPQRSIELMFQTQGYIICDEYKDNIYIFYGGLGGERDYNYMPTLATYSNPYLNISRQRKIGTECIVVPNDYLYLGLLPIHEYYSKQETETDLSMKLVKVSQRLMSLLTAPDERTKQSLDLVFKDLLDGKLSSVVDDSLMKNIESFPYAQSSAGQTIIQLLEAKQYEKGSWWNEIGVQSNYNMKRETITANENILNVDSLLPLCDIMLECRKKGIEEINKKFGTDISVDLSSSWKKLRNEIKITESQLKPIENVKSNQLDKIEKSKQLDNTEKIPNSEE